MYGALGATGNRGRGVESVVGVAIVTVAVVGVDVVTVDDVDAEGWDSAFARRGRRV